jgi:hypothetical protein
MGGMIAKEKANRQNKYGGYSSYHRRHPEHYPLLYGIHSAGSRCRRPIKPPYFICRVSRECREAENKEEIVDQEKEGGGAIACVAI